MSKALRFTQKINELPRRDTIMFEPPRPWEDILDFWLGPDRDSRDWPDEATAKRWFRGGPALDAEISERFGPLVEAALGN